MKSFKTAIISLVVLVVAIAGFFVVKGILDRNQGPEDSESEGTSVDFVDFDPDAVVRIEASNTEDFVLIKEDDVWKCDSPADLVISSSTVSSTLTSVSNMTATLLYDSGEFQGNLFDFGLNDPSLFTMYMEDGSSITVKIGVSNISGSMHYAMLEGSDRIYGIGTTYSDRLLVTRLSLISGNVLDFDDTDKIQTVEMKRDGELYYRIEAEVAGEEESEKTWNITAPVKLQGMPSQIDTLIEALTSRAVSDIAVPACDNLDAYGLEVPYIQYIVSDDEKTETFEIGNKTSDGSAYYCTINGRNDVYTISASNLTFLDDTVLTYGYPYAFFENYKELSSIDIEIFGDNPSTHKSEFFFDEEGNDEQLRFDGVNAIQKDAAGTVVYDHSEAFYGITTYLYALQLDKLETEQQYEPGPLLCRITYHRQDGTSCTVEAFEREEGTAYLYVDGSYMGGYCDMYRIFSDTDHQGIVGTINAYLALFE